MKKNSKSTSFNSYNALVVAIIIVALSTTLLYKQPVHAASERGKTAAAVLGGGGLGALIVGVAASGKWAPLGFGAGAVGGLLLKKAIQEGRKRRNAQKNGQTQPYSRKRSKKMKNDQSASSMQYKPLYNNRYQ